MFRETECANKCFQGFIHVRVFCFVGRKNQSILGYCVRDTSYWGPGWRLLPGIGGIVTSGVRCSSGLCSCLRVAEGVAIDAER